MRRVSTTITAAMLALWRRHLNKCPHRAKGRAHTKCACPIWADGELAGKRYRKSLGTRDWQRAIRKMAELENPQAPTKTVPEAIDSFLEKKAGIGSGTFDKYERLLGFFQDFCKQKRIASVRDVILENLDAYRRARLVNDLSWTKELELLRQFFGFCVKRKWCSENPAGEMEMPAGAKPKPRQPYSKEEVAKILAACDTFGKYPYERLRARAMILLMRYSR